MNAAPLTKATIDQKLLEAAITALARETGLELDFATGKPGNITLAMRQPETAPVKWVAITKKWAVHTPFAAILQPFTALPGQGLLVADYINPVMAQKLKDQNVQFIDTAGNTYLNQLPVYVWITGKKPVFTEAFPAAPNKGFTAAALKIIFCLLCDAELVNAPYRAIAEDANVALGTVGDVLKQLKALGYIRLEHNTQTWQLRDQRQLLDEWLMQFPQKLKNKFHYGTYIADDAQWWETCKIEDCDALWGSEVAAAKLTGYLKPGAADIYIPNGKITHLMKKARLRKPEPWERDQAGLVHISTFTLGTRFATHAHTVCPILVYADLMAQDDPRLHETAEILYDQHIKPRWQT